VRPAQYRFLTTWLVATPCEPCWNVIEDPVAWPEWWRGVERVEERDAGDGARIGSRYLVQWRSRIPYSLTFEFTVERVEPPALLAGVAHGQLDGHGCWRLFERDGVTAVVYEWDVETTKPWMNLVGPIARPVFEYNHDVVMRWGGEGLARRLGVRLLAAG
jgi:uncharacterized protein YndB with AHSA1/START domain